MKIIQKNISEIKNFWKNNRKHPQSQIDVLKKSLIDYWRTQNCVIEKDGTIVIWHGRIEACRQLTQAWEKGWDTIPCIDTKDLTKSQIRKLRIIDNKSSEMAEWDIGNLKVELDELGDLELNDLFIEMDDLKLDLQTKPPEAKEDDYVQPEVIKTDIKRGDLITFYKDGKELHRLLCGDSTSKDDVENLMNGEKADMVFTDPPYWANMWIMNDWVEFAKVFDWFVETIPCDDNIYICCDRRCVWHFATTIQRKWYELYNMIIRVKNLFWQWKLYHTKHEEIIFLWKWDYNKKSLNEDVNVREADSVRNFWGSKNASEAVWHPTQKPVEICARAIKNSSDENQKVYDWFWGSGSTMVACHQLNRKCYMQELDEKYCKVICDRMQKLDPNLIIKKNWNVIDNQT